MTGTGGLRRRRAAAAALAFVAAAGLGGCVETAGDVSADAAGSYQFVRRPDAAMSGATVAILSVVGAPDTLGQTFDQDLDAAAAERQIALAPPTSAKYLVRGYLDAARVSSGSSVSVVFDVFTRDKQRAQRLTDTIVVAGSGDDPWAMVAPAGIGPIPGKAADDHAAYHSNTPQAAPGSARSYAQ